MRNAPPLRFVSIAASLLFTALGAVSQAQGIPAPAPSAAAPAVHPALFLVGDSTMRTGTPPGDKGPWGWGYEIGAWFDPAKIHIYNDGLGGRSSRSYIDEGAWAKVLAQLQAGDFVIFQFGHNDTANSENYPDRTTINSGGEETLQVGVGSARKIIHSYGWYLRKYIRETQAKGATAIVCSPVPRNGWADGKIKRGFDGYAGWAAEAAKAGGAFFIDLNSLAADRYDALGQKVAATYFNDFQHVKKAGAKLNASAVAAGIRGLTDCPLSTALLPDRSAP